MKHSLRTTPYWLMGILLLMPTSIVSAEGGSFQLPWFSINQGGTGAEALTSDNFRLHASLGQAAPIGQANSSSQRGLPDTRRSGSSRHANRHANRHNPDSHANPNRHANTKRNANSHNSRDRSSARGHINLQRSPKQPNHHRNTGRCR